MSNIRTVLACLVNTEVEFVHAGLAMPYHTVQSESEDTPLYALVSMIPTRQSTASFHLLVRL